MSDMDSAHLPPVTSFCDIQDGCVRVQPIMHIARTISELGADPERVFAQAGIPADLFANPENTISLQAIGELLEICVAATGCEHFGLLLGAWLFGCVTILQFHAQGLGIALPVQFLAALPYLATVVVLVLISRDKRLLQLNLPASLGKPWMP